nr:hypothetical protein CUMW_248580 [Ipomoea batatas]
MRSIGDLEAQVSPILKMKRKKFCTLLSSISTKLPSSSNSTSGVIPRLLSRHAESNGSTISITSSGNAISTYSQRLLHSPLNKSSVGLLAVNISNKRIPKLYTSPKVDAFAPIPNDTLVATANTPTVGTSPSRSLKERFKYCKSESFWRSLGISPVNLFFEISKYVMLFKEIKEGGTLPSKRLSCISRYSRLKHSPIVFGISPDNLFPETSKAFSVFNLPTAGDNGPVNELRERSRDVIKAKSLKGSLLPRRLYPRFKSRRSFNLPILSGTLPTRWLSSTSNSLSLEALGNEIGIVPCNLLPPK